MSQSQYRVKVTFRHSGAGFSCDIPAGMQGAFPETLHPLLRDAVAVGAAHRQTELSVPGWGPARWVYTLDREVLRDLLKEANG